MFTYYGKLKHLWDELTNYENVIDCCCGGHSYARMTDLKHLVNKEKLHQFILRLDDSEFNSVTS